MNDKKVDVEKLLAKAKKPAKDAMKMHPFFKGKVEVTLKSCVRDFNDFAIWYTPGVAAPCRDIHENPEKVYEHTNKGNFVAVVSDGSRVLGLGDIGPEAGLPVMEGKALLFKYLGGVDAFPICINEHDPDKIVEIVKALEPTFGGINLEDFSQPKCFEILERCRNEMNIPVWHDDQQGTATVTLAGLINALKVVGKKIGDVKIALIGAGAANICISRIIFLAGVDPKKCVMVDSKGILNKSREDLNTDYSKEKWDRCLTTNEAQLSGGIAEAMKGADVVIGLSKPGPGTIKPEWVSSMADDSIVFACANPIPEIWPWEAKEAGARVVSTGRSDFPNQVNNSVGFPAIFRGVLDVWANTITDSMCVAAAESLANSAVKKGISEDYILPTMDDVEAAIEVAVACGMKAMKDGTARRTLTEDELRKSAKEKIERARKLVDVAMREKIIPEYTEE
ncbi:NADP-dependent malic enzyme [bacterium]|nr:NADP-dependent malic enzyme [bacterium]